MKPKSYLQELSTRIAHLQAEFARAKRDARGTGEVKEVRVGASVVRKHTRKAHNRYVIVK